MDALSSLDGDRVLFRGVLRCEAVVRMRCATRRLAALRVKVVFSSHHFTHSLHSDRSSKGVDTPTPPPPRCARCSRS